LHNNNHNNNNIHSSLLIRTYRIQSQAAGGGDGGSDTSSAESESTFQPGTKIQVEVISFGPLGATVDVIGVGSHDLNDVIPESEPPLATGLILQREIQYYRQKRNNVDVVRGEILPAYVEKVRDDLLSNDPNSSNIPKLDISLRAYGGKAKTDEASQFLLDALYAAPNGVLPIGDKSTPTEIAKYFPGISKGTFKKAVASLYKQQIVQPSPFSIQLIEQKD
jgi:hypothetical protein